MSDITLGLIVAAIEVPVVFWLLDHNTERIIAWLDRLTERIQGGTAMSRRSPRAKRPVKCKVCRDKGVVMRTRKVGLMGLVERKVVPCPECGTSPEKAGP